MKRTKNTHTHSQFHFGCVYASMHRNTVKIIQTPTGHTNVVSVCVEIGKSKTKTTNNHHKEREEKKTNLTKGKN